MLRTCAVWTICYECIFYDFPQGSWMWHITLQRTYHSTGPTRHTPTTLVSSMAWVHSCFWWECPYFSDWNFRIRPFVSLDSCLVWRGLWSMDLARRPPWPSVVRYYDPFLPSQIISSVIALITRSSRREDVE